MNEILTQAQAWLMRTPTRKHGPSCRVAGCRRSRPAQRCLRWPIDVRHGGSTRSAGPGPAAMNHIVVAKAAAGCANTSRTPGQQDRDRVRRPPKLAGLRRTDSGHRRSRRTDRRGSRRAGSRRPFSPMPSRPEVLTRVSGHGQPQSAGGQRVQGLSRDGMQIVSPADAEISARIAAQPSYTKSPVR